MKIKITRTTVADGQVVRAGKVYDVPDADAKALILLGKAVAAEDAADEVQAEPEPELTTEALAPVIETEAPKIRRGKTRKG
jgi:hypothetical protein